MQDDRRQAENGMALGIWGKINASMSHELANAVAILSQASGLLGDLLDCCDPEHPISPERLRAIHERLERQTSRATELVQQLNYLAHSVDRRSTEVELNSLARTLVAISSRLALMKGVELTLDCSGEEVRLTGDPYGLLQALFLALEHFYENAGSGGTVEVTVARDLPGVQIRSVGTLGGEDDRLAVAQSLATRMGARATVERCAEGTTFSVTPGPEPR